MPSLSIFDKYAPCDAMPLNILYFLFSRIIVAPGLSSVPAKRFPIITVDAPAANAFTISPGFLIPPSDITGTSYLDAT